MHYLKVGQNEFWIPVNAPTDIKPVEASVRWMFDSQ
jgi:hypothetical protein